MPDLDDVNQQHLASMGLVDQPLGQRFERPQVEWGKGRCESTHPEDEDTRCALPGGHSQPYHARGRVSWREEPSAPPAAPLRRCDNALDLMPHAPHTYVIAGEGETYCPGYVKPLAPEEGFRLEPSPRKWDGPTTVSEEDLKEDGIQARLQPTKRRPGDQVLPTPGQQCVQDLVIAEMEESKRVGLERYGSTLQTFNGRRSIQDVAEEIRDLHVYIKQIEAESAADRETLVDVVAKALHPEPDGEDVATAEIAVDAVMGWVVGQRQDQGTFADQQVLYDFLDDAWPRAGGRAEILECLTHAVGDHLDIPAPEEK